MVMLSEDFKTRLTKILNMREMRPIDLANKTGISKSLICKYMAGVSNAKQDNLSIIAKALGVNPIWLMGYDVPMDDEKDYNTISSNEFKSTVLDMLEKTNVDPNLKEQLEDILNNI